MNKLKIYKRGWLKTQNDSVLFNICQKRNINTDRYFVKIKNKHIANKSSKPNLIDEIILSNPENKDRIHTYLEVVAIVIAILTLLFGIYKFIDEYRIKNDKSTPRELIKPTAGNKLGP
jgi:hypothetical protein